MAKGAADVMMPIIYGFAMAQHHNEQQMDGLVSTMSFMIIDL